MTDAPVPDGPTILRVRDPGSLLEAIPFQLGFHPADSVVVCLLKGDRRRIDTVGRTDLPAPGVSPAAYARALRRSLPHRRGEEAIVIIYGRTGEPSSHRALAEAVATELRRGGRRVVESLYVGQRRWWSYRCRDPRCCPPEGTELAPPGTSIVAAEAILAGRVAAPSREERALVLAPAHAVSRAAVRQEVERAHHARVHEGPADRHGVVEASVAAVEEAGRVSLSPSAAAELLLCLTDVTVRDRALAWIDGARGDAALALWCRLGQLAGDELASAPLTMAAFVSWRRGDGALANIALDRALAADPTYSLALLLRRLVDERIDPRIVDAAWPELEARARDSCRRSRPPRRHRSCDTAG